MSKPSVPPLSPSSRVFHPAALVGHKTRLEQPVACDAMATAWEDDETTLTRAAGQAVKRRETYARPSLQQSAASLVAATVSTTELIQGEARDVPKRKKRAAAEVPDFCEPSELESRMWDKRGTARELHDEQMQRKELRLVR